MPLYVFDEEVYDDPIGRQVMKQYKVPHIFVEDLFQYVNGHSAYPSYRCVVDVSGEGAKGSCVKSAFYCVYQYVLSPIETAECVFFHPFKTGFQFLYRV